MAHSLNRILLGGLLLACLVAAAGGQDQIKFPTTSPCRDVGVRYTAAQVARWPTQVIGGQKYLASPPMEAPAGDELGHHRLVVRFVGRGPVAACIAAGPSASLAWALKTPGQHRRFGPIASGREMTFNPFRRGQRFGWVLVLPTGGARIAEVRHTAVRGAGTLYGHAARTFTFDGGTLPYRLMYPKGYDPRRKYPLVISVAGSGSVGTDNVKNMELVILARFLYTDYYNDPKTACFSLVPQIPPPQSIPEAYWPRGRKGAPTPHHPDWATVNENGWYTQATLALIERLKAAEGSSIDPDRVYFTGFSYGGKACWEFLRAGREVFAAAVCGAGWPIGRCFSTPAGADLERLKQEVSRHKHIPVHIFVGAKDRMRFGSAAVHKAILAAGGKSTYDQFPDTGHVDSAGKGWTDRERIAWLFAQNRRKNPAPGPDPYPGGNYDGPEKE